VLRAGIRSWLRTRLKRPSFHSRTKSANGFLNGFEDPIGSDGRDEADLFRLGHSSFVGQASDGDVDQTGFQARDSLL
jgi:hypothetical protein